MVLNVLCVIYLYVECNILVVVNLSVHVLYVECNILVVVNLNVHVLYVECNILVVVNLNVHALYVECNILLVLVLYVLFVQGHIQVTFVEPYFEEWELKERQSVFERSFNISK